MGNLFTDSRQKSGILLALFAFGFWGAFPVYFKLLASVSPGEILCHRIIWSVPFCALLITWNRDWPSILTVLRSRKTLATLLGTAALVSTNWFVFIQAITTGHILQASLGYYINPLVNVLLGVIFLRERLRPRQILAVVLAAAGTANLAVGVGAVPWISLILAFTFGMYGFFRKTVKGVESVGGLFVETTLIAPAALIYMYVLVRKGELVFLTADAWVLGLLLAAGALTSVPLASFTAATRRLQLSTVGLIQYLTPTLQFLLAVVIYKEPFTVTHLITFALIWVGLAVFAVDTISAQRAALRGVRRA